MIQLLSPPSAPDDPERPLNSWLEELSTLVPGGVVQACPAHLFEVIVILPNRAVIKIPWLCHTPEQVAAVLYHNSLIPATDKLEAQYGPRQKGL